MKNKNKRIETKMSSLKSHASYQNTFKTDFRYFNTDTIHLNVLLVLKRESMSYTRKLNLLYFQMQCNINVSDLFQNKVVKRLSLKKTDFNSN